MVDFLNSLVDFFNQIPHWISYCLFGLYMGLESAGVPLPNEVVLLFAGYLAHAKVFNIYTLIFIAILGSIVGVIASYYLGYLLGEGLFKKLPQPPFLSVERQREIDHWLHKKSFGVFVFTRFIPFVRTYISIFAGINKVNPIRLIIESLIGTIIWCSGFLALGFLVGEEWEQILNFFHKYTLLAVIILVFVVSVYIYFHFIYKKESDESSKKPSQFP